MKIIIVGAGISGLSTYLFLRKHLPSPAPPAQHHEVLIYETYDSKLASHVENLDNADTQDQHRTSISVGGGLGIMGNGLNVLKRLSQELFHNVLLKGHPILAFKFCNARGWELATMKVGSRDEPPMTGVMISRQALWNSLRERVEDRAISTREVIAVIAHPGSQRNVISFADASPDEHADLVIGADGLRSVVRKAIFRDGEVKGNEEERFPAHYEGLVGVGGFVPSSLLTTTGSVPGEVGMVFGAEGFFGYGYSSSAPTEPAHYLPHLPVRPGPEAVWWSTYELPICNEGHGVDREDIRRQLIARHSHWENATVRKIIQNVKIDTIWPTWTTPQLPTWERDGLVLVGDSAHTLQPSSGQGTSQALEDCEAFVLLLSHYLGEGYLKPGATQTLTETDAREIAAKKYVDMRIPRLAMIYDRSQKMGNMKRKMGWMREMLLYLVLWLLGFLAAIESYNDKLINYNVSAEVKKIVTQKETMVKHT